jgi:hypothetical protein
VTLSEGETILNPQINYGEANMKLEIQKPKLNKNLKSNKKSQSQVTNLQQSKANPKM